MYWILRIKRGIEIVLAVRELIVLRGRKAERQTRSDNCHIAFSCKICCNGGLPERPVCTDGGRILSAEVLEVILKGWVEARARTQEPSTASLVIFLFWVEKSPNSKLLFNLQLKSTLPAAKASRFTLCVTGTGQCHILKYINTQVTFSCRIHGETVETERSLQGRPPFVTPAALGAAGLGDSRYRLGSSWCISVCWVWAAAVWAGETKGWMVWGLERWEKGGGQRRGWVAGWLTNCFVRWRTPFSNNNSYLKAHCLSAFHHHYLLSLVPSAASISSLLVRGHGMSQSRSCLQLSLAAFIRSSLFLAIGAQPVPIFHMSICYWACWRLSLAMCASPIRLREELGLSLPCTGPVTLSSVVTPSLPLTRHCISISLGLCSALASWGPRMGADFSKDPRKNVSLFHPSVPMLYQDCHWLCWKSLIEGWYVPDSVLVTICIMNPLTPLETMSSPFYRWEN